MCIRDRCYSVLWFTVDMFFVLDFSISLMCVWLGKNYCIVYLYSKQVKSIVFAVSINTLFYMDFTTWHSSYNAIPVHLWHNRYMTENKECIALCSGMTDHTLEINPVWLPNVSLHMWALMCHSLTSLTFLRFQLPSLRQLDVKQFWRVHVVLFNDGNL